MATGGCCSLSSEVIYSRGDVKAPGWGSSRFRSVGHGITGVLEHNEEFLLFANVGTAGRTGHDYDNRWEGPLLRWCHQGRSHLGWASVRRLLERDRVVHVFWRGSDTDPFVYAGYGTAIEVEDRSPVEILWAFSDNAPDVSTFAGAG